LTHFDARPACASTGASALQLQPDFEAEPLEARQRGGLGVEQWVELLGDLGTHQIYHPKSCERRDQTERGRMGTTISPRTNLANTENRKHACTGA
jgi:hypothetical protein